MAHETNPPAAIHSAPMSAEDIAWLTGLLEVVRERKGLDFSGYRMPTLLRRARNRMLAANVQCPAAYAERLRSEPAEADALVERFTIKVSKFFRDRPTFDALATELRRLNPDRRLLRAWSAGCAQGEEPYSLAILLAETGQRCAASQVFATDIDGGALAFALRGRYNPAALENLTPSLLGRHFEVAPGPGAAYHVNAELRRQVAFRRHDLAGPEAPPATNFDLICCRNVLIYMQPALQERVVHLLARSLVSDGLLCLGEAEWLPARFARLFEVVDRRARLFRRNATPTLEDFPDA